MRFEVESVRDFIILHYKVTDRSDSTYWSHCKNLDVPASLAHKIALFKDTGRVFRVNNELFDDSWMQVMIGQGLEPKSYHPIVDNMSEQELQNFLSHLENNLSGIVGQLPSHGAFLQQFCPANIG